MFGQANYSSSKAGIIALTKVSARELARQNITVNAIAPGIILVPGEEERRHPSEERIPLRRYGTVADITSAVLILADGAPYMTGSILHIDGGSVTAT